MSILDMELLDVGYKMTVDLYKGVIKSDELNKRAIRADAINIMRTLFLYSIKRLHRYLELKMSFCLSSISFLLRFFIETAKLGKIVIRQSKKCN